MKNLKSHFVFNRSQRNGIFLLVLLIIILLCIYFFVDFTTENSLSPAQEQKTANFQQKIDSLKQLKVKDDFVRYPFNPNFISDYKGYVLGMSLEEIDKLHAYRKQEKWINSEEDFQRVTSVSDSLLEVIAPYFKFPDWVERQNNKKTVTRAVVVEKGDLNRALPQDLIKIKGIGAVLSKRIVKYRESIGGFRSGSQLYDVYGLEREVINRVMEKFKVVPKTEYKKKDLNSILVVELTQIPYFNYELARKVVEYRKLHGGISTFKELTNIDGFPSHKIERIKLYLSIQQKGGNK